MKPREYYIYRHCYKTGNKASRPFYVGMGVKPPAFKKVNREYERAYEPTSRTKHWNNIVNKYGYTVEIMVEDIFSLDEAFFKEKEIIALYGRLSEGGMLCNFTDGGEGAFGRSVSDETRKRIGDGNRGKKRNKTLTEQRAKTFRENQLPLVTCVETGQTFQGFGEAGKQMFPSLKYAAKCIARRTVINKPYKGYTFTAKDNPNKTSARFGGISPLCPEMVSDIKRAYNTGEQINEIAKRFKICPLTIRRIKTGVIHKDVLPEIDLSVPRLLSIKSLSDEDIREIRSTTRGSCDKVAAKFGIDRKLLFEIKAKRAWKNVI